MSSELPEDVNRWPADPWRLLGIERGASERDAKRAYFKMARKFKPDKAPLEFQKIRTAWESIEGYWQSQTNQRDRYLEDFQANQANETDHTWEVEPNDQLDSSRDQKSDNEIDDSIFDDVIDQDLPDPISQRETTDQPTESERKPAAECPDPWQLMQSGKIDQAWQACQHIDNAFDASAIIAKYTMMRWGEKASQFSPTDRIKTLIKALSINAQVEGEVRELLEFELIKHPELATDQVWLTAISENQNRSYLVGLLLSLRWATIGCQQPEQVVQDCRRFLQEWELQNHEFWLRMNTNSLKYTIWNHTEVCAEHTVGICEELARQRNDWYSESADRLLLAVQEQQTLWTARAEFPNSTHHWIQTIPLSHGLLLPKHQEKWTPIAHEISNDPAWALKVLDQMFSKASVAMGIFRDGLDRLPKCTGSQESRYHFQERSIYQFVKSLPANYRENRPRILGFCLRNFIQPGQLATVADRYRSELARVSWRDVIDRDQSLYCVFRARSSVA